MSSCRQIIIEGGWCEKNVEKPDFSSLIKWFHFTHNGQEFKQFHKLFYTLKFSDGVKHDCFFNILEIDEGSIDKNTLISLVNWSSHP